MVIFLAAGVVSIALGLAVIFADPQARMGTPLLCVGALWYHLRHRKEAACPRVLDARSARRRDRRGHHGRRVHKTLRLSPAKAAGVSQTLWTMEDIIAERIEARQPQAGKRGLYKKRVGT
jgi:hypothetical protein